MEHYRPGRFQILPLVVKNLLIVNFIFFAATIALERFGIDLVGILGLHYFASENFEPYQLLSYMFMHGGFSHIFFNMFALWIFGYAIENFWGPKRFLIYYIITGIGASLVHYGIFYFEIQPLIKPINQFLADTSNQDLKENLSILLSPYYNLPLSANDITASLVEEFKMNLYNTPVVVGASGAVFGILLAFGMMFPNSLIYIYFLFPIKAKYLVILYGVVELFSGVSNMGNSNIAHFAHLGGMVFGFILLKYWKVKRLN